MNIKQLHGVGPPSKVDKQSNEEIRIKKVSKEKSSEVSQINENDQVEISKEAMELQNSPDEIIFAKELLSKLPSVRAQVIYEALAKMKAGLYSSEEIIEEASFKLLESSDFKDLI